MDEQDPRIVAERTRGRGDERVSSRDTSDVMVERTTGSPGPSSTGSAGRTRPAEDARTAEHVPEQRTRVIRAEIEQTREDMAETVDAIQERLRPSRIASNAADSVKNAAIQTSRDLVESEPVQYVRANPLPAAMVGIGMAGLVWLAFGGREARPKYRARTYGDKQDWRTVRYEDGEWNSASGGYSRYRTARASSGDLSKDYRDSDIPQESPSHRRTSMHRPLAEDVRRKWEQTTERARETTSRAQDQVRRTWNENPLLIGAAAAIVGAAVGLALPETQRENELMGETRDDVVETVQDTVREKVNQVQDAATSAVNTVQQAAKAAVGLPSDSSANEGS